MNAPPLKRGSLYWARLDKRRPVLVISPDYRNERATDVIIVPASTTIREAPTHVVLRSGEGGVRTPTVLKCEQVTTLPRTDLELRRLGEDSLRPASQRSSAHSCARSGSPSQSLSRPAPDWRECARLGAPISMTSGIVECVFASSYCPA